MDRLSLRGDAKVCSFDYGIQGEGGAGFALAPRAVAAVYTEKGGENFVRDGLACALALEGREGFGCHCKSRISEEGVLAYRRGG